MVGEWTNEPCSGVDVVVNHFWVLTLTFPFASNINKAGNLAEKADMR